jgi:hypothetical protein
LDNEKKHQTENFLYRMISRELEAVAFGRDMCTRFPPEPNGYLHIGSAYAIHTNYSIAERFNGTFHLRFDDTNPLKEDIEYVNAIIEDIKWLGYDPGNHIYYGSDYSDEIYNAAVELCMLSITEREMNGASIRCTILPILFKMRLRASPIPYAQSNSKITGPCTNGS